MTKDIIDNKKVLEQVDKKIKRIFPWRLVEVKYNVLRLKQYDDKQNERKKYYAVVQIHDQITFFPDDLNKNNVISFTLINDYGIELTFVFYEGE